MGYRVVYDSGNHLIARLNSMMKNGDGYGLKLDRWEVPDSLVPTGEAELVLWFGGFIGTYLSWFNFCELEVKCNLV
jgi:hypothetical protein